MTATPPPTSGQIDSPNPLELFWEKNKRGVILVSFLVVAGLATNYAMAYFKQQAANTLWSGFSTASRMDVGYAEDGSLAFFLENARQPGSELGQQLQYAQMYLNFTRGELTSDVQKDIKSVDDNGLRSELDRVKGTAAEPLLLWVGAVRASQNQQWAEAKQYLDDLQAGFPTHFLCHDSGYPPQFRPVVEKEEDESEPDGKSEKPELEPAQSGSCVSMLRAQIEREEAFRKAHPELYEAPEPDAKPEVVIRFSPLGEEIRIRFYREAAPTHVDGFLALVRDSDFYVGQRVDQVQRGGVNAPEDATRQLHFGLAASKDDDRAKWEEARGEASKVLHEFEENGLSHFPGMVAAVASAQAAPDGKSSGERVWINANEAVRFDGQRVIFGRVVEGLDVINQICDLGFVEEEMEQRGQGTLQTNVTIESITIVNDIAEPKAQEDEEGTGEQAAETKPGEPKNGGK